MSDPIHIDFVNLHKAFGPKVIYRGLDLAVRRGEVLTVIGGSGTGKSVLLKILIGLLRADRGKVLFDGQDVSRLKERDYVPIRRRIAMLFQGAALFDSLTVGENVAYPLREHFNYTEGEIARIVAERLDWVGMPGIEHMRPSDLSGGMQKRVGLARAVAMDPEVILYDEPTTGLDPINVSRIDDLIKRLRDRLKATAIVVTHDMGSAYEISDRMAMLWDQQIIAIGTVDEIRNSTDERVRRFVEGRFERDSP